MTTQNTRIFDANKILKSTKDGLPIMPWRLLHDGYQVTQQETVNSVDADSGVPITHSKFTVGGRIISAKIYTDTEVEFWIWWKNAIKNRALPFWVYDTKIDGFMKCHALEQATWSPAGSSVHGGYAQLKLYARSMPIPINSFITENMTQITKVFDTTKFDVAGDINITDDGIASGFNSSSNYLILTKPVTIKYNDDFEINFQFTVDNDIVAVGNWVYRAPNPDDFAIWIDTKKMSCTMAGQQMFSLSSAPSFSSNGTYTGYVKREGTKYTFYYKKENSKATGTSSFDLSTTSYHYDGALYIGGGSNDLNWSANLKEYSVKINGVEVFKGSKDVYSPIDGENFVTEGTIPNYLIETREVQY